MTGLKIATAGNLKEGVIIWKAGVVGELNEIIEGKIGEVDVVMSCRIITGWPPQWNKGLHHLGADVDNMLAVGK